MNDPKGPRKTDESPSELILDGLDGVTKMLQMLVIALQQSGSLDTAHFAQLLVALRGQEQENSMQEVLIDRMLTMLVDDPQTLIRRMAIRAVSSDSPDTEPGM